LFSENGRNNAVWKDEHEQTETAVLVFGFPKNIYKFIFFERFWDEENLILN